MVKKSSFDRIFGILVKIDLWFEFVVAFSAFYWNRENSDPGRRCGNGTECWARFWRMAQKWFLSPIFFTVLCTSFWYISVSNIFFYTVEQDSCQIGPFFFGKKVCKHWKKVCKKPFLDTTNQDCENGAQTGQIQSPCFPPPCISLFPLSFGNI